MSETRTRERPVAAANPFEGALTAPSAEALPMARPAGPAVDRAMANIVTAQRVAVKREVPRVLAEIKAAASHAGSKFYYRIPFKDRKGGEERVTYVEGPSIHCAMAVATLYGNCSVEATVAEETQAAWIFAARFVDYEKGVTIVRSFQQRKSQSTGMKDGGRNADILFQIGQSKAIRNVIVAALPLYCEEAWSTAKDQIRERVAKNPDAARSWLLDRLEDMRVPVARVERVVGRPSAKWTVADLARIYSEVQSVADGMVTADEVWPPAQGEASTPASEVVSETAVANGPDEQPQGEAASAEKEKPAAAEAKPAEQPKAPASTGGLEFG